MKNLLFALLLLAFTSCGIAPSLSRYPAEDQQVYSLLREASKKSPGPGVHQEIASEYERAVQVHLQQIEQFKNAADNEEELLQEYAELNRLADAVQVQGVRTRRFDAEYAQVKQQLASKYYNNAKSLLQQDDRAASQEAYDLLQKVQKLSPGYGNVNALADEAYNKSILKVVINPVDYHSRSFSSWGFNNDYIQQELVRDLKYQLSSSNVRFYTDWEARANHVTPDRVIDIRWNEMYIPIPIDQSFSKQVSRQIQVGHTADKQPIYQTVSATVYVTRRSVQSHGILSCRVYDPTVNRVLLLDEFPASNNWQEELRRYQRDHGALGS